MDTLTPLSAISPLDGRYSSKTEALRPLVSEHGLIKYRFIVEVKWLLFLLEHSLIGLDPAQSSQAKSALNEIFESFAPSDAAEIKQIESTTNHDVKAVEYYLGTVLEQRYDLALLKPYIHIGCTSEDINNLAYGMMFEAVRRAALLPQLSDIRHQLATRAHELAAVPMLSRTHGQTASPTTVGKEFAVFAHRLERQLTQLQDVEILGKFGGAVSNYNAIVTAFPEHDWRQLNEQFVRSLGLTFNPLTTQIESHDYVAEYCGALVRINTILIDLCRDFWGYISLGYFRQKTLSGEVGSSTMPHKVNPIDFENAEGNLGMANAVAEHFIAKLPISRWQRDLTDSTVLRNFGTLAAYCSVAYQACSKGLGKIEIDQKSLEADLNEAHEVLTEAVQTVMRRYGIADAYDQLKTFSRGTAIDADQLQRFIRGLDLPDDVKSDLLALTPSDYVGLAPELARSIKK